MHGCEAIPARTPTPRGTTVATMRRSARFAAVGVSGYLAGSLPSADLAARAATGGRVDLRAVGSGNPGAVNTATNLGARWGAAVTVADVAKGTAACAIGRAVAGAAGAHVAGPAAVVGHCYPLWSRFRGGKGVATSVGQVIATFPAYFPLDVMAAAVGIALPKGPHRAFVANTVASVTWVTAATVWWRKNLPNLWGSEPTAGLPLAAAVSSLVIFVRFLTAHPPEGPEDASSAEDAP